MNSEQKDKLLKLAENNPDLAKDVVDILKADTEKPAASETPVAVKIVKDEADKIVITEEQKQWVKGYFTCIILAGVFFVTLFVFMALIKKPDIIMIFPLVGFILCIPMSYLCVYKAGMPTIKKIFLQHFKFS